MIDHDPGDEDRRDVIADTCPFCGGKFRYRQVWNTPVFPRMLLQFSEAVADPTAFDKWVGEVLMTCLDCKPLARRFAELQRVSPEEKEARAYIRDYERRAGLRP